jgi:hypothetical protein
MEQEMAQHEEELWGQVFGRENLVAALERVRQNGGAPGVDEMTVEELPDLRWSRVFRQQKGT